MRIKGRPEPIKSAASRRTIRWCYRTMRQQGMSRTMARIMVESFERAYCLDDTLADVESRRSSLSILAEAIKEGQR